MKYKIITFFFVAIILTAGISISICTIIYNSTSLSVEASVNVTCGRAPLNVSFTSKISNSDNNIEKYMWDFDDGGYSNIPNPNHIYINRGTYIASVTVWDENGGNASDTIKIHVIEYYNPLATISASCTCGKPPLNISFSGGGYDFDGIPSDFTYHWDFDDGTTSTQKNPYHIYKKIGTYYVRLEIKDKDGLIDTDSIEINIIHNYPPMASVSADTTIGKAPLLVNFKGTCEDIDDTSHSYEWFFEDTILPKNRNSNEKNPSHRFWFPGIYNVSLTVKDKDGAEDTDTITIMVQDSVFSWTLEKFIKRLVNNILYQGVGNFIISFISNLIGKIMNVLGKIFANIFV